MYVCGCSISNVNWCLNCRFRIILEELLVVGMLVVISRLFIVCFFFVDWFFEGCSFLFLVNEVIVLFVFFEIFSVIFFLYG